jgi:hypothetical protein
MTPYYFIYGLESIGEISRTSVEPLRSGLASRLRADSRDEVLQTHAESPISHYTQSGAVSSEPREHRGIERGAADTLILEALHNSLALVIGVFRLTPGISYVRARKVGRLRSSLPTIVMLSVESRSKWVQNTRLI